jgi:hypothetical protein
MSTSDGHPGDGNVVPLSNPFPPPQPEPVSARPGPVHGLAIAGMSLFAVVGIVSMLLFVTVTWPGNIGRYIVVAFVTAGFGFIICAIVAVFAAARDTYPQRSMHDTEGRSDD